MIASDPAPPPAGGPAIRATDLVKTFGTIRAVDGVSFELAPGRIYGVLGPNGAGKTTLIRLLTGMGRATSGVAEVLGVVMPSRANLARIGYMTQSDGVYPALTALENVRFFGACTASGTRLRRSGRSRWSTSSTGATASRRTSREACGGACRSPAPSSTARRSCSSTSRPSASIPSCGSSSGATSAPWPRRA